MERDVYEPSTGGTGVTFTTPYFYDGMELTGISPYAECANSVERANCTDLHVCVVQGTTYVPIVTKLFPQTDAITLVSSFQEMFDHLADGECNVLVGDVFSLSNAQAVAAGFTTDDKKYVVGESVQTHEPLALVTRDDDAVWSDFVNWVVISLIYSEEKGYNNNNTNTSPYPEINYFGEQYKNMFNHVLQAVGGWNDIFNRHSGGDIPRLGLNQINSGKTGLMYSAPFGNSSTLGPKPTGIMDTILNKRNSLVCGVSRRPFFGEFSGGQWTGFDIDICRALAAALFHGVSDHVLLKAVNVGEQFDKLRNGEIDIMVRSTAVTFEKDVTNGTSNREGLTFSQPLFYDEMRFGGVSQYVLCLYEGLVDVCIIRI